MKLNKTIWSLFTNGLEFLSGFGIIAIITRFFPLEDIGKWFIFMSVFSIVGNMRDAFVQTALVKGSVGMDDTLQNESLKANLVTTFSLEIIFSTVILIVGLSNLTSISSWLLLYPIYSIPNALFRWVVFYLRSRLNTLAIFKLTGINLVLLGLSILYILINHHHISYIIIAWGLANIVTLLVAIQFIPLKQIIKTRWNLNHLKFIGKYGIYATLRELTSTLSTRMGIFLSGSMLGLSQTALLGTGQRYSQIVFIPNNSLQGLLFPDLVKCVNKGENKKARETLEVGLARILGLVLSVGALIILFSYPIVRILHGVEYLEAIPILIIYVAISSFFTPFGTAFGSFITAIGKPQISSKIVFIDSVINIILTWVLIKTIGLYGAPISLLLTEIFGYIMIAKILKKEAKISFGRVLTMIPVQIKETLIDLNRLRIRTKPAIQ